MSIKFRKDGPTYPTSVSDGKLVVYMGTGSFVMNFDFLKSTHEQSNVYFPMCNIMAYLENDIEIIVMRFDGTVTKYTKDYEVIGFSKFDVKSIYSNLITLPVGCVFTGVQGDRQAHTCSIRMLKDTEVCVFECSNDPEPLQFIADRNPKFCEEIVKGNRIFPALVKVGPNQYADEREAYSIESTPIHITGTVDI